MNTSFATSSIVSAHNTVVSKVIGGVHRDPEEETVNEIESGQAIIDGSFTMRKLAPVLAKAEVDSIRIVRNATESTLEAAGNLLVHLGSRCLDAGAQMRVRRVKARQAAAFVTTSKLA